MNSKMMLRHLPLYARKAIGKIRRRLMSLPPGPVIKKINGRVNFEFKYEGFLDKDDILAMLTNSYDIILCDFLKKNLTPGSIFIDVGANVGYISAVAASYIGQKGEVHDFEPLKPCFSRLMRLRELNPGLKFFLNNTAVGAQKGEMSISYDPKGGARNATLVSGYDYGEKSVVPVLRLDEYIFEKISRPELIKVIKIDVEGFEFPVLRGLERFLDGTSQRPDIVCEVKPWELKRMGFSLEEMDQYLKRFSYRCFDMVENDKLIDLAELQELEVVLFRSASKVTGNNS